MEKKEDRRMINKELMKRIKKYIINTDEFKYAYEFIEKTLDEKLKEKGY